MRYILICIISIISMTISANNLPPVDPQQIENSLKQVPEPKDPKQFIIEQEEIKRGKTFSTDAIKSITVKKIIFEGNTVFLDQDLTKEIQSFLNKKSSFADLENIANKITDYYRLHGYSLAMCYIPAQEMKKNILKIKILEGVINRINIKGNYHKNKLVVELLDKIYATRPFDVKKIEKYMMLINDLPGVTAQAVLKKSSDVEEPGGVDLDIIFKKNNTQFSLGTDDNIADYLGKFVTQFNVSEADLIFNNHLLGLNISRDNTFQHFKNLTISDKITLNSEGTSATIELNKVQVQPGYRLKKYKIKSNMENYSLNLSKPFIRSRHKNLTPFVGFKITNFRSQVLNTLTTKDHIRALSFGTIYDFFDNYKGGNLINFSINKGLDILDSTHKQKYPSKRYGRIKFLKTNFSYSRLQHVVDNFNMYFNLQSQFTNDSLLSSELFGVGGNGIGKGYGSSALTGDKGYATTYELRYRMPQISIFSSELYSFYDYGKAWNKRKLPNDNDIAVSYGLGLRCNLSKHSSIKITVAKATTAKVAIREKGKAARPTVILLSAFIRS